MECAAHDATCRAPKSCKNKARPGHRGHRIDKEELCHPHRQRRHVTMAAHTDAVSAIFDRIVLQLSSISTHLRTSLSGLRIHIIDIIKEHYKSIPKAPYVLATVIVLLALLHSRMAAPRKEEKPPWEEKEVREYDFVSDHQKKRKLYQDGKTRFRGSERALKELEMWKARKGEEFREL